MVIKTDTCAFSGFRIYPGHGTRFVPTLAVQSTRPVYAFITNRCSVHFKRRRNPRDIPWTMLYRRQRKKGVVEEYKKARRKKIKKVQRAIAGATLEFINAQKLQTPAQRKQLRKTAEKAELEKRKKLRSKREELRKKEEAKKKKLQKTVRTDKATAPTRQPKVKPATGGKRY